MAKNDKPVIVNEGATYEAKDGGRRVVAFHVDRPRSRVLFAPVGSSREDRLSIDEFLDSYELVAQQGELTPEAKKANDEAEKANAKREPRNDTRTNLMDTKTASPTREAVEARKAERNRK